MVEQLRTLAEKITYSKHNTTRIKVSTNLTGIAENNSSGSKFNISTILLARPWKIRSISYYETNNLYDVNNISIEIDGRIIDFPEKMKEKLAYYMREQHIIKDYFDCVSFVHLLNSIDYANKGFYTHRFIIENIDDKNSNNLKAGDTVFISKSTNPENYQATHFAVCIGENLYISKFGSSGKLIVTDIDNMMKGFGGNYIFKMIPKF
jgi:hypothetical protein